MKKDIEVENQQRLGQFLCFAIYTAGHAFNRVYKPYLTELGLTYPQYLVMVALWEKDEQTVSSIGTKLFLESNTLTPLLKRLEGLQLLERTRNLSDERQVCIRLTDKGNMLREKAAGLPQCIAEASGLDEKTLSKLRTQIIKLRDELAN